jgi:hypothetical protein
MSANFVSCRNVPPSSEIQNACSPPSPLNTFTSTKRPSSEVSSLISAIFELLAEHVRVGLGLRPELVEPDLLPERDLAVRSPAG